MTTSWTQNSARQPKAAMIGEPSETPIDRTAGSHQAPPTHGLHAVFAGKDHVDQGSRGGARGGSLNAIERARKDQHLNVVAECGQQGRRHRPHQTHQVEPAVSEDVAGLAQQRRGQSVREEWPHHRPGQDRDRGVELARHRGQSHDEHREGEVQRKETGEQRPQDPPLVARRQGRAVLDALAQQGEPVEVAARLATQRAKGRTRGVGPGVKEAVGIFSIHVRRRALVVHESSFGSCAASSLTVQRSSFSSVSVIVQF